VRSVAYFASSGTSTCASGLPQPVTGSQPRPARYPVIVTGGSFTVLVPDVTSWKAAFSTKASAPADREPPVASGGGFSNLFPKPGYQDRIAGSGRGVPDVSGDASPVTGMAVAYLNGGRQLIGPAAGTSASAPFWAGIVALADQYAGRHLGFINPAIYRIGESTSYHAAFHDITSGDNSVDYPGGTVVGYHATAGWDPVTGWGSPDAQVLVPLLAS
jgi:subtilase family serine protease